jgi:hypothetical protein
MIRDQKHRNDVLILNPAVFDVLSGSQCLPFDDALNLAKEIPSVHQRFSILVCATERKTCEETLKGCLDTFGSVSSTFTSTGSFLAIWDHLTGHGVVLSPFYLPQAIQNGVFYVFEILQRRFESPIPEFGTIDVDFELIKPYEGLICDHHATTLHMLLVFMAMADDLTRHSRISGKLLRLLFGDVAPTQVPLLRQLVAKAESLC